MTTISIIGGFFLILLGVVVGGYTTLIVERNNAERARAEGYEAGLKARKGKESKPDHSALKKAEKKGYQKGYAEATAEFQETLDERISKEADALIAQGYEAGLAANLCEAELVMKAGKSK